MRNLAISCCCWIVAILATVGLVVLKNLSVWAGLLIIASIFVAAIDNKKSHLWRYQAGLPVGLMRLLPFFLLLIFVWFFTFPFYLGLRLKTLLGVAKLREEYQPWNMADG